MSLQPHDTPENLGAPRVEGVGYDAPEDTARSFGAKALGPYHLVKARGDDTNSHAYDDLTGDNGIYTNAAPGREIEEYPDQRE